MPVPNPLVMSRSLIRCVLVIVVLLLAGRAEAQWQVVSKPSNDRLGVIYFLNEFNGFIGYRTAGGQVIAKTTDGGSSWNAVTLEFSTYSGDVSDIQMVDGLNGWATCDATDAALTNRGLYRTTDGGVTWRSVQVITDATSVLQLGRNVYLTSRRVVPLVPMMRSIDGGATWQNSTPTLLNDVSFVDPLRGVASRFERASSTSGDWFRTVDGGNTWIPIPNMDESWSVYGEWGTPNFYAVPEDEPSAQNAITGSPVIRSTDYGQTWQALTRLNFHSTGHLAVASGIFYFQVSDRNPQNRARASAGIYRSTNKGVNWTPVGGPSSEPDTRFSATGCLGGVVYASDAQGNLWKTRTGGDGAITEPPFTLEFGSDTIRISSLICATRSTRFSFRNLYCSPDSIISIALDPSDAATTGAITLTNVPVLPKLYRTDEGDQFDVNWDPSKLLRGDSTIYVRVRLRYYSTATKTLIDTSIVVAAHATGAAPTAELASTLDMGEVPSCAPSDSLFTITNTGCDTMYITQPPIAAGSGVALVDKNGAPLVYPITIPPGGTDSIYVLINSSNAGIFNVDVALPVMHQKVPGTFTIRVTGNVVVTGAQFAVAFDSLMHALLDSVQLDRGTMTRCDPPQEFYLYVRNPGCTEVALRNAMFEGDGSVFNAEAVGTLPDTLSGTDLTRIRITVTPALLGRINDRLRVRYKIGDEPSVDLFYPFTVDIGYGTRELSLGEELRDLDTVEYCELRDTVIRFQNRGCDTLTITGASLTGADYGFVNTGTLPRKIAPGAYDSIIVQYDPLLPGDAPGSLLITSDADSLPSRTIALTGYALPTDTLTFNLVPEREIVNDNDTLNFTLFPDTTIRGKGLRSLSVILSYNGDVLTFMSASATLPGLTILQPIELETGLKARQLALTLLHANEITLDSLIGLVRLKFRTTLSDSTHVTMTLSDYTLNGGDPLFAKCVLGSRKTDAMLVLTMFCGDSLIKKTLLEGKLVLSTSAPSPNPSSRSRGGVISLPYVLNASVPLHLEVYSVEGVLSYELLEERQMGAGALTVPIERLPSGTYHYTVRAGGSVMRGKFVVAE